ncbi:LysE family translocator [Tahibacter amnicola]|uniref:LysE family transporter n=1 Tax=Tahibacter amnicola TaxID=2976241 RepID=A0ABY6BB21_9GAMM|nr:LysE family transporter [Tahibacter amnicola]UXI65831.1 LysE family transporter [Tahibacter amnicola]
MSPQEWSVVYFVVAATALLGSPGPGILSLVAIGRTQGWRDGLRYYAGLQLGLATAAAASVAGLASLLIVYPAIGRAMTTLATLYLLYLAWCIARSPVGTEFGERRTLAPVWSGFALGIANPKAYPAFASLLTSHTLLAGHIADGLLKWSLLVTVILIVDIAWLMFGVSLKQARLNPLGERAMNWGFALLIVTAALWEIRW